MFSHKAEKNKKNKFLREERKIKRKVLKFSRPLDLRNLLFFSLFLAIIAQSSLLLYFYSRYQQEIAIINQYKEALRFILREGGGFNYSICSEYIMPDNPKIVVLARQLKTPENAFNFVVSNIEYRFEVTEDLLYPFVILNQGYSNCVGEANLLASLLIAQGQPEKNVWVVYGSVVLNKNRGNHAWVEFYYNNKWIVLDPTLLTPFRGFDRYERHKFYSDFKVIPVIRYNNRTRYFVSY